jgi:cytochrome c553
MEPDRMRHVRVYGLAGIAALAAAAAAFAQTTVTPLPEEAPIQTMPIEATAMADLDAARPGDAEAGATKAAACAACHGVDGNPADPQYPRIAGQSEHYVARQLALFKSGERATAMAALMQPYAMPLSAQDMRDIGAYFATQTPGAGVADDTAIASGPYAGMAFYQVGEQLYRRGDAQRGIPACMACHGPAGRGNPGPAYPQLSGQHADYTARMLQAYRDGLVLGSGEHANDVMSQVAADLTDEEIQALASYLEGLHPRAADLASNGG